nr:MAG TPA: hypothetical protein [Caudoviricetes sp.]
MVLSVIHIPQIDVVYLDVIILKLKISFVSTLK